MSVMFFIVYTFCFLKSSPKSSIIASCTKSNQQKAVTNLANKYQKFQYELASLYLWLVKEKPISRRPSLSWQTLVASTLGSCIAKLCDLMEVTLGLLQFVIIKVITFIHEVALKSSAQCLKPFWKFVGTCNYDRNSCFFVYDENQNYISLRDYT